MRLYGDRGHPMDVTDDGFGMVETRGETFAANAARNAQRAFTISCDDPDPGVGEYILWVYNNATERRNFVVDNVYTWQVDADVVWRLWEVSGTGATSALITAKNTYLGSAIGTGDLVCRGGAGGVTGLTTVGNWIDTWGGGYVYNTHSKDVLSAVIVEPGRGVAVEYDAGTTGRAGATIFVHFYPYL
jgi:hypothetical protein